MADKAIVLVSGGLDSSVALWIAKSNGWRLYGITFNYHMRNEREIEAAEKLAKAAGVEAYRVIELPFLRELRDMEINRENLLTKATDKIDTAYVPGRNAIFYSIAASWAEVLGARWIVGGHHNDDFLRFPDSKPEYFQVLNQAFRMGTILKGPDRYQVVTPLIGMNKTQVVSRALQLNVPVHLTWSCYEKSQQPCGQCHACTSRRKAFSENGLRDPADYITKAI